MKQNITAFIIFTVIVLGSLLSLHYTKSICTQIEHNQKMCEESVLNDNWSQAIKHIQSTKLLWDKHHPRLAIMLAHRDLDEINSLIVSTTSLALLNDKNTFITENKRLMALVENLRKKDILTFENLF